LGVFRHAIGEDISKAGKLAGHGGQLAGKPY